MITQTVIFFSDLMFYKTFTDTPMSSAVHHLSKIAVASHALFTYNYFYSRNGISS